MPLQPGTRLGVYDIVAELGVGGMGEVYQATDTRLKRGVALKVLPDTFAADLDRLARFQREAELLARLNHPNIAAIYGLEESTGVRALVLELVEGPTLADRITTGPIPLSEALPIARQIAEALEAAHEHSIIHRDLKPANIKVRSDGTVKVLDLGLAKLAESATAPVQARLVQSQSPTITTPAMTGAGTILGTAAYMSPEQAEGLPADKRSDIWSYGVVLWEMLTGQRLFDAPSVTRTLADVLRKEIDFTQVPADTPPAVRTLVRRCLDRELKNRLRDIGEARIAIDLAAQPSEPVAEHPTPRSPLAWIAATAVFALGLGALAFVHFRETPPERQHLRFQVAPPEGELRNFKLSPDGRFLAFAALDGSAIKLWIRALDGLETRLLTSARLDSPFLFWSADGEFVGFLAAGKISKVAKMGGSPVAICDLPGTGFGGAAWGRDGTILFATSAGLYRVSSAGGTPSRVPGENADVPVWLTAERFLFTTPNGIFAASLAGAKPSPLLPDASNAAFVPPAESGAPGHVLFIRGDTLMAQSIDAEKAQLRGEAFPVADRVGNLGNRRLGAFSASATGVLVFGRGASSDSELVWLDRTGKKLQTVSRPFQQASNPAIRLSPDDGRAIVPVAGAKPDLWIADLNRNALSRFTFDGSVSGIWSPDGRIVLWAANDGNRYLRAADGSGKDELVFKNPTCDSCYPYGWSSDGKRIAFAERPDKTDWDIWLVGTDGDRKPYPYLQSRFAEFWAAISPDGRWMAYQSNQPGQTEILVESIPTGRGRWQISTEGGDWPVWRRDGKELFFRQGTKIMAAPIRLTDTSVESGKPQALFAVPTGTRFQVSRDGQRFLIALPVEGAAATTPLTVDTDWRAGVGK